MAVLAAVTTFVAIAAPAAHGSVGVVGWFGNEAGFGSKGGELNNPRDIGVNRSGAGPANEGDIYVVDEENNRVQRFDSEGNFTSAWGANVETPGENENQKITVNATGGSFKLIFEGQETAAISATATGTTVRNALRALPLLGPTSGTSNITVAGSSGGPWTVEFCGEWNFQHTICTPGSFDATNVGQIEGNGAELTGGAGTIEIETTQQGSGEYQICTVAGNCRAGAPTSAANAGDNLKNGSLSRPQSIAVDNDTGNVYVSDRDGRRINEYDGEGNFIRSFGWGVDASTPGEEYEICEGADRCQRGAQNGSGEGQIGSSTQKEVLGIAVSQPDGEASDGTVFLADSTNRRVNMYNLDGTLPVKPSFGSSANFGTNQPRNIAVDSNGIVFASNSSEGAQVERYDTREANELQTVTIQATSGKYTLSFEGEETGEIEWNASPGEVEAALNGLTTINTGGGSVSVSGGPGDETGTSPYEVTFDGGPLAGTDVAELAATDISLAGGNPSSTATVATTSQGSPAFLGPILASHPGANERQRIHFNNPSEPPTVHGGDKFVLRNLPASCSSSETEEVEFSETPSIIVARIIAAWEAQCGAGGISGFSGPYNPQFDFFNQWAETNIPQIECEMLTGGGHCEGFTQIDGAAPGTNALPAGSTSGLAVSEAGVLYVLRDAASGPTVVQRFNEPGAPTAPTASDEDIGAGAGFGAVEGFGLDPSTGTLYISSIQAAAGLAAGHRVHYLNERTDPSATVDEVSGITSSEATVSGTIDPNELTSPYPHAAKTEFHAEFKLVSDSTWTKFGGFKEVASPGPPVAVTTGLSELTPLEPYEVRYVARKQYDPAEFTSAAEEFTTLGDRPRIDAVWATEVRETSAKVHAKINELGTPSTYCFEYGTTTVYGSQKPSCEPGVEVPGGEEVEAELTGLSAGSVYHFRAVATNSYGTSQSPDQTFEFFPPGGCPNNVVRQQTGAAYLPDCRGYELVNPPQLGGALLFAEGPASPYPSSVGRFPYVGLINAIPGAGNPPNGGGFGDFYVASRTSSGWKTKYVGIPGDETISIGGAPENEFFAAGGEFRELGNGAGSIVTDTEMNHYVVWDTKDQGALLGGAGLAGSSAPYVYDNEGHFLGRLPTNLEELPGEEETPPRDLTQGGFYGSGRVSGDFTHYIFSSRELAFAPDGKTVPQYPGSLYDNDLSTGSVEVISNTEAGEPIESDPAGLTGSLEIIISRFVSQDGSRVLMSTRGGVEGWKQYWGCNFPPCGNNNGPHYQHLYMHDSNAPNASKTYEVSWDSNTNENVAVTYEGVADEGRKVLFTTPIQMGGEDHDSSIDLYMWSEATNSVKLLSVGAGNGNTDSCSPELTHRTANEGGTDIEWVKKCGVEVVPFRETHCIAHVCEKQLVNPGGLGSHEQPIDSSIAAETGEIYFYSPEILDNAPGAFPDARNLYVYRNGSPQFVKRLAGAAPATRINVSKDGTHMGLITKSRLTAYDNAGHAEMYVYDPAARTTTCVSCRPDGQPPSFDVEGSQNGRFMTDDGRAFFATKEALVPRDGNGINDVYEFVNSRIRLISSGTGTIETISQLEPEVERRGLIGVTGNGVDAFFGTYDTMVGQDENGGVYKIYDARTNGGFPFNKPPAPCEAADECHGPESQPAAPLTFGTGHDLGPGGNVTYPKKPPCRKGKVRRHGRCVKKHRHKRRRHHRRHRKHRRGNG